MGLSSTCSARPGVSSVKLSRAARMLSAVRRYRPSSCHVTSLCAAQPQQNSTVARAWPRSRDWYSRHFVTAVAGRQRISPLSRVRDGLFPRLFPPPRCCCCCCCCVCCCSKVTAGDEGETDLEEDEAGEGDEGELDRALMPTTGEGEEGSSNVLAGSVLGRQRSLSSGLGLLSLMPTKNPPTLPPGLHSYSSTAALTSLSFSMCASVRRRIAPVKVPVEGRASLTPLRSGLTPGLRRSAPSLTSLP